jgi:hypothetical protein
MSDIMRTLHEAFAGISCLVRKRRRHVRETDGNAIQSRIRAREEFNLIDIREDNEWEQGTPAGATHLGKGIIERDIEMTIPDHNARSCSTAAAGFAPRLRRRAAEDGLHPRHFHGRRYRGWVEAGNEIEK